LVILQGLESCATPARLPGRKPSVLTTRR